jgi:hypothetical protein
VPYELAAASSVQASSGEPYELTNPTVVAICMAKGTASTVSAESGGPQQGKADLGTGARRRECGEERPRGVRGRVGLTEKTETRRPRRIHNGLLYIASVENGIDGGELKIWNYNGRCLNR